MGEENSGKNLTTQVQRKRHERQIKRERRKERRKRKYIEKERKRRLSRQDGLTLTMRR